jgi:RHS repeat-associated protein
LDRFLWVDELLVSAHIGASDYYIAHDALGSVVGVTSALGATEETYTYDPYGNLLTSNAVLGAPSVPLGFEAQLLDPSGLYDLAARLVDPTTGTYLSQDPLMAPAPDSSSVSPYTYVDDEPTVLVDPTGEFGWNPVSDFEETSHAVQQGVVSVGTSAISYAGNALRDTAGDVGGYVAEAVSTGYDVVNAASACIQQWYSVSCEMKMQQAGVDVSVDLVSFACTALSAGLAVVACQAVASAGGQFLLDRYGYHLSSSSGLQYSDIGPQK